MAAVELGGLTTYESASIGISVLQRYCEVSGVKGLDDAACKRRVRALALRMDPGSLPSARF